MRLTPLIRVATATWLLLVLAVPAAAAELSNSPALHLAQLSGVEAPADPETIIDGSQDEAFQPLATLRLMTSDRSDQWYRLELGADWTAMEPPVLSFRNAEGSTRDRIWVYAPPAYQAHLLRWIYGSRSEYSPHALAHLLPVDLRAEESIYLRLPQSDFRTQTIVTLTPLSSYMATGLTHARLNSAFASVQVAMLLIGLFLWLLLRDRMFLYFMGYIAAQLTFMMLVSGEMYQLPGGSVFAALGGRAPLPFSVLTAVLAISFIIEFCDLRTSVPRAAILFGWSRWPLLVTTPLILLLPKRFDVPLFALVNWLILLACVIAIGSVLGALYKGNRQARFFFAAWIPELAFTVYRVVQIQAGWDQPEWAAHGFAFSMAFATLVIAIGVADQTLRARRERDIADDLAHRDQLTGIFNRRAVLSRLDTAVAEAHRNEHPLALLFIDVDHFKSINDTYGHAAGDHCLQRIVEVIGRELRDTDWMGRYGGEEFVVVLPETGGDDAGMIGERVRAAVEAYRLQVDNKTIPMTISIGVAGITHNHDNADVLLGRADTELYRAKSDGRNRISMRPLMATAAGVRV